MADKEKKAVSAPAVMAVSRSRIRIMITKTVVVETEKAPSPEACNSIVVMPAFIPSAAVMSKVFFLRAVQK